MRIRRHLLGLLTVATVSAVVASGAAVPAAQAAASDFTLTATAAELGLDAATLRSLVSDVNAEDARDGLSLNQGMKRQTQEFGYDTSDWINLDVTASVSTDGTLSVTVNLSNNDLEESYLPAIGNSWTAQDLTVKYGTPPV